MLTSLSHIFHGPARHSGIRRGASPIGRPLGFGDRQPAPVAASALSPLGLADFDPWILGYEFLGNERDSHAPTRMNREHPAEFGE